MYNLMTLVNFDSFHQAFINGHVSVDDWEAVFDLFFSYADPNTIII